MNMTTELQAFLKEVEDYGYTVNGVYYSAAVEKNKRFYVRYSRRGRTIGQFHNGRRRHLMAVLTDNELNSDGYVQL